MSIRAILQQGVIRPVDPLPSDWIDGQELLIEEPGSERSEDLEQWKKALEKSAAEIPEEEHDRFLKALDQIELESKEAIRKQWGKT